ncbi:hypothetical protein [Alteromonas sp. RKMC-009]|uniref:hypothetical protein n=1 Tax=Alteromonas sp. RKMC-009 TaxID=2267264 RepID=UPI000E677F56|nr:hypothetical protein [Alteromonas sp. RKMC-009]AYA63834.1 hypothetical protein DS731_07370 [Alteromonas sp. RKMC-009]
MSDLQWQAVSKTGYAWANTGDRLIQILNGASANELVRVIVLEKPTDDDLDGDIDHIHTLVTASIVDELTGEPVVINNAPVQVNFNASVNLDEMEDADAEVPVFVASAVEDAVYKALRRKQTLIAKNAI